MRDTVIRRSWLGALLLAFSGLCAANVPQPYGKVALSFEPNLGQTDARVSFLARAPGVQVFLSPTESVYRVQGSQGSNVLRMRLRGANGDAALVASEALPGRSHYLQDADPQRWIRHVPHYARVSAQDIYPGIDVAYYGKAGRLEYDFIVAPGVDPRRITIEVEGARRLRIDAEGRLVIETAAGPMVWEAPLAYQERDGVRETVPSRYRLRGPNRVGFHVAGHDRARPLVIDPVLAYSTLVGGSGHDRAHGIAVDANGEAVITGVAGAVDYPTTSGAHDRTSGGVFVTRLNATGTALVYSTFLGAGRGLAVALQGGHAYVAGSTRGATFATPGAYNHPDPGVTRGFIAKLAADGSSLEYGAVIGPGTEPLGIAVDGAGAAYVAGTTSSLQFPVTAGAFQPTRPTAGQVFQGDIDGFFLKLNPGGSTLDYASYLGSSENDLVGGIAVDSSGHAYVAGTTLGRTSAFDGNAAATLPFPTTAGAYQTTFAGIASAFLIKFNPTQNGAGSVVYSTFLGDGGGHSGQDVAVDAAGNAYVVGGADSTFPFTAGAYGVVAPPVVQPADSYVAKINAAGSALVYAASLQGVGAWDIALDGSGNAFVTGLLDASHTFTPVNGLAGFAGGDLFLTKLAATGATAEYSTYLPGHLDNSVAVAVDPSGNAYVSGTAHIAFTTTPGAYQSTINGAATEAFVLKVTTNPPVVTNQPPVANAGPAPSVFVGQQLQLDGSGSSDPDGDPLTYEWRDAGNNIVGTSSTLSLSRPQGQHTFTLRVSDGQADSTDTVTANVAAALTMNFFGDGSGRIASTDGKIDCHSTTYPCMASYITPSAVTLVATPDPNSAFGGWVLQCSGTGACTHTVNQNIVEGARFDILQPTLTITPPVNGKVTSPTHPSIDCGSACSVTVPYDTEVDLAATPDNGFVFNAWGGACSGSAPTCKVKLQSAQTVTASFSEVTLTGISITPASATVSPGRHQRFTIMGTFSDGSTRALSADHAIEGSDEETCGVTRSGVVKCWGQTGPFTPRPAYFGAVSLSAGTADICALLPDGKVNCEGTDIAGAQGAVAIASASTDNFAVMPDATVQMWSRLTGGGFTSAAPVPVAGTQPPAVVPIDVGAEGGLGACVLLSTGQVSCFRDNAVVPGLSDVVAVTVGVDHACALLADGRVKCWGDNDHGQLGRGTIDSGNMGMWLQPPDFVVETVGGVNVPITDAIGVMAGDYHACALMRDTSVKCWGRQWTSGSAALMSPVALTIQKTVGGITSAMTGVTGVAAGAFHTCAAMNDGTANCWGLNSLNILGNASVIGGTEKAVPAAGVTNLSTPSWSSTNGAIAAVMASGRAIGKGGGTTSVVATLGGFTAMATLNVVNTGTGSNVSVTPTDAATGTSPVTVTFSGVTQPGETTVVINPTAPPGVPTTRFGLGSPTVYYDISTTAAYTPPITICIDYTGTSFGGTPALYHFENGAWTDVTTSVDTVQEVVCGQVSSLSPFALLVPDTTPPQVVAATASPAILWPPNHQMVPVTLQVSAIDGHDPAPQCLIESAASNEPVEGLGDGDTAPDWEITGVLSLNLRAERSGKGAGRVYEIRVRCTDLSANSAVRTVAVRVPLRR